MILVVGRAGQLGSALVRALGSSHEVVALGRAELDLADPDAIRRTVAHARPRLVLNAAAYTAVDRAESETDLAHAVNAIAPGVLAEAARDAGAALVHYSTDYVFDGAKGAPWAPDDDARPLSTYGRTKRAGELAVLAAGGAAIVLRTSWLSSVRAGFVANVLDQARQGRTVRAVTDQVGSPTTALALAAATARIVAAAGADPALFLRERAGIHHAACDGVASRFDLATFLVGGRVPVEPARTADFPSAAERPAYSALDSTRLSRVFGVRLPRWTDAFAEMLAEK